MINREEYLDELIRWKDKDLIKVVTGIRRCGKSTLFDLFIDYLKMSGVKSNQIIYINLEDADYDFKDYKELYHFINEKIISEDNLLRVAITSSLDIFLSAHFSKAF